MNSLEKSFSQLALKAPWITALLVITYILFSFWGLKSLTFNVDPSVYYDTQSPNYKVLKDIEDTYGKPDNIVIILHAQNGTVYNRENLALLEEITNEAWKLPYVSRVDSVSNHNHSWSEDDEMFVEALGEEIEDKSTTQLQQIKRIALGSPELRNRLTSANGEMALIRCTLVLPSSNKKLAETEISEAAQALVKRFEKANPDIDILLSGGAIHNYETDATLGHDMQHSMPLMYAVIFSLLGLLLRSFSAMIMIMVVTLTSCLSAFGLSSIFGVSLNTMSISALNIIITVTIAHCVHIHIGFMQKFRTGISKLEAIRESLALNMIPITLTSITTMLGFLSMNFSKMPPARDLGNISAIGVITAFILTMTLVPLLLKLLPFKQPATTQDSVTDRLMGSLSHTVVRKRGMLFGICALLTLIMLPLASTNIMNDRFTESIKLPNQYRSDNTKMDKHFGGMYSIEYNFEAQGEGGISEPEYLNALDKFVSWLREQPNVKSVHAYSDLIKRLNQNMHNDDPSYYTIPKTRDEAAQYQLLFEMSQPMGSDMNNTITPEKNATRLIVALPSTDTRDLIELHQRADIWVAENMPEYMHKSGGSLSVLWAYIAQKAVFDGIKGALFALTLISIILIIVFRSVKIGLISLIPNLLPMAFGYGIWALMNGQITMIQTLVMSLTIGIVVDDTVHFLSKYLRARNNLKMDQANAVRFAFKSVGSALLITTLILMTGFGMMLGSSFIPNSNMGMMTMFILGSALFLDFFMLPPLLMLLDKKTDYSDEALTEGDKDNYVLQQ
jgi:hypothetical protein